MKVKIGKYLKKTGERKTSVEISTDVIYSLDVTLSHIITPALIKFKEKTQSYPGEFINNDVYKDCHTINEEIDNDGMKKWDEILDKMIWSFREIRDELPGEQALYEASKTYSSKEFEEYHTKLQEGLELFGKYYRHLWS